MRWLAPLAAAALLGTAGLQAAAPARKAAAPAARDWTRTVTGTPEGGFRIGNPAAPVKLVEYGSLTCPHCAEFSAQSKAGLPGHIRSGRVSFEFRNMVLNAADVSASLLARCAGPRGFFPMVDRLYATQPDWLGKVAAQNEAFANLPDQQKFVRIAEIGGLTQVAAQAGVTPARAKTCLVDKNGLNRLVQMYQAAHAAGVQRTPTFLINGRKTDAHEWASLEPLLKPGS
jgi:protein-disulfide isomerase